MSRTDAWGGRLALAATPTFAAMALLTAQASQGPMAMLCGPAHGFPPTGMTAMYLLMSLFHSAPWLRLISSLARR